MVLDLHGNAYIFQQSTNVAQYVIERHKEIFFEINKVISLFPQYVDIPIKSNKYDNNHISYI